VTVCCVFQVPGIVVVVVVVVVESQGGIFGFLFIVHGLFHSYELSKESDSA